MNSKSSYLLIFKKTGLLKYISHLDLLRLFQRVLRRSDLPVVFSKGFHPIPKIKIKKALKLGLESEGEEMCIDFKEPISSEELKNKMNNELPSEIRIVETNRM